MEDRPRHPNKELEQLLRLFEQQGWRVIKGRKYFKTYCPCEGKHKKTVHMTPSDPNYELNVRKWLQKQPCFTKEGGKR